MLASTCESWTPGVSRSTLSLDPSIPVVISPSTLRNGPSCVSYLRSISLATRLTSTYKGGLPISMEYKNRMRHVALLYGLITLMRSFIYFLVILASIYSVSHSTSPSKTSIKHGSSWGLYFAAHLLPNSPKAVPKALLFVFVIYIGVLLKFDSGLCRIVRLFDGARFSSITFPSLLMMTKEYRLTRAHVLSSQTCLWA